MFLVSESCWGGKPLLHALRDQEVLGWPALHPSLSQHPQGGPRGADWLLAVPAAAWLLLTAIDAGEHSGRLQLAYPPVRLPAGMRLLAH